MKVKRFERLDFSHGDLAKPEKTPEGYWRLEGKVARTGIQIYRDSAGGQRRELRRPEDVKASLSGFALTPLTNGHPPTLVQPDTAHRYVAGAVGEAQFQDGWVKAPITVWTRDAIEAVKAGRAQLSVGYSCTVVEEPGEWNGEKYDSYQTDIQVNHVALVDAARAGPDARLRLDQGDASSGFDDVPSSDVACDGTHRTESAPMVKLKLDGFEVEVADANAATVIEKSIERARKDGEDKSKSEKDRADAAEKELAEVKAKRDEYHATVKAYDGKMVTCDECDGNGKCDGCGGSGKMKMDDVLDDSKRRAAIARIVAKRVDAEATKLVSLIERAKPVVPTNLKLDGLKAVEIKREMVKALIDKDQKLDGDETEAVLDAMLKVLEPKTKKKTAADAVREAVNADPPPVKDEKVAFDQADAGNKARQAMIERSRARFAGNKK